MSTSLMEHTERAERKRQAEVPAPEIREYTITGERSAMGRSTIDIRCPFCHKVSTAYVWSLAGSGKRCENRACRALFTGRGLASRA